MSSRKRTHTSSPRVVRRAVVAAALAVVGRGVLAAPSGAGANLRPDLVAAGPVGVSSSVHAAATATVTNIGNGDAGARRSAWRAARRRDRPVKRLGDRSDGTVRRPRAPVPRRANSG